MSCKIINEELRIQSCSIDELEQYIKETQDKKCDIDIAELIFAYDKDRDLIIMNASHEFFDLYKELIIEFMKLNCKKRDMALYQVSEDIHNTLLLLDSIIKYRDKNKKHKSNYFFDERKNPYKKNSTMRLISFQATDLEYLNYIDDVLNARNNELDYTACIDLFNLGYIYGKRTERNKRKRKLGDLA